MQSPARLCIVSRTPNDRGPRTICPSAILEGVAHERDAVTLMPSARSLIRRIDAMRPIRTARMAEFAASDPACWRPVFPPWQASWPAQRCGEPVPELLRARLPVEVLPAQGVLTLRGATVLGDGGWIFAADGRIAVDTTHYATASEWMPRVHRPLWRIGTRRLRGRTLSLLSGWASFNFFHMLLDVIPRIELVFAAGWSWDDFDHVLLPAYSSPTVDRLLETLAIPRTKVIHFARHSWQYLRTDELVCTSFPGAHGVVSPTSVAFLRRLRAPVPMGESAGRMLFVRRRSSARHLRNEDELAELAVARGFVVIDPGELPDAEAAFAAADVIVGTHGASLANLVFCRPGTRVLELLPSDQAYPYFFTLAVSGGLHYDCLIGQSDVEDHDVHPLRPRNSPHDFTVDRATFAAALERLLSATLSGFVR